MWILDKKNGGDPELQDYVNAKDTDKDEYNKLY